MKKRIALLTALSLLLTACGTDAVMTPATDSQVSEETTQASSVVKVTITEISGNTLFVKPVAGSTVRDDTAEISESEVNDKMQLKIANTDVPVTWEDNESVAALKELLPLTIEMSMYGGFEQVGAIGQSIVRNDVQTVTKPGDIVLYSGNQIVVFYGSNSWSYTRLGHVDLSEEELTELLSNRDVTITIN